MLIVKTLVNLLKVLLLLLLALVLYPFLRVKSVYFFLRFSGTTFIKFGQVLSTRPDLTGERLASILSLFQDKLPPFSFLRTKKIILKELKSPLEDFFMDFNVDTVSSGSVAQVYKAKLKNGDCVAVKVLRPKIDSLIQLDLSTLKALAFIFGIFSSYYKDRVLDIVRLVEYYTIKELDLAFEAGVATELRDRLINLTGFYIPKVYWDLTTSKILVLEWIEGIPFSDKELIRSSSFNKVEIAKNLVVGYFNQVYVHGFFHADMHPGNLFLMNNGSIGVVDFGIVGTISKKMRIAVAEILIAFLDKDYKRVARIHIDAGLVPEGVNVNDLAVSIRVVGESIVGKSVRHISLAKLLVHLIKMTKSYNMRTDPELLLLQKTVTLVEGVGVILDEDLNLWDLARPWMKEWSENNIGFDAKICDVFIEVLETVRVYFKRMSKYDT